MSTTLLKGRYNYLYLGKFLEQIIKHNDLSSFVKEKKVPTGPTSYFTLDQQRITYLLQEIYQHKDKKNMFGYLTELSAIKGIVSSMKEILDNDKAMTKDIETKLGKQFFAFDQIIRLTRNVLTHSNTTNFVLKVEDFASQRDYLSYNSIEKIHFSWKKTMQPKLCKQDINIFLDFTKIRSGQKFLDIIPLHSLYLLCEVCYELCQ